MEISRKTDYALRMLFLLAEEDGRLVSVRSAAEQVNVPYSFARSIQHELVEAGILESRRGVNGGMRLKADPKELTIRQIVEAIQGPLCIHDCTDDGIDCPLLATCCYHPLWTGVRELVNDYLDSVTLDDMVHHRRSPAVDAKFADRGRFSEYAGDLVLDGERGGHEGAAPRAAEDAAVETDAVGVGGGPDASER